MHGAASVPVWPYANMHTLYPSSALVTSGDTSSNTSTWLDSGGKARSKSKACGNSDVRVTIRAYEMYTDTSAWLRAGGNMRLGVRSLHHQQCRRQHKFRLFLVTSSPWLFWSGKRSQCHRPAAAADGACGSLSMGNGSSLSAERRPPLASYAGKSASLLSPSPKERGDVCDNSGCVGCSVCVHHVATGRSDIRTYDM